MDLRLNGRRRSAQGILVLALLFAVPQETAAGQRTQALDVGEAQAERIAARDPKVIEARRDHPDLRAVSERNERDRDWEVGFHAEGEQLVEVVVDDETGVVEESWSGHQVAWGMARGYEGAFGRKLNAPYVWLPLCALFALGLLDWRRPLRMAHLDLIVIVAGFGLSHYFFNRGEIGLSVPLAYPPLLYLLGRMLWIGFRRGRAAGLSPSIPALWLGIAAVALLGFRVALNVTDSNVIDVGYAGVIGADLIADGEPLYGNFPQEENHAGDTYWPWAYYAYLPFEQVFSWSGTWDDLPAAHAAAIFFDLATALGLLLLGRLLRPGRKGWALGAVLAFAWAACPYTAFALESNSNDSLVALMLVAALLVIARPAARGVMIGLAAATKIAPLALGPLFATYQPRLPRVAPSAGRWGGSATGPAALCALAIVATLLAVSLQALLDPGLSTFWDRTAANQADRDSPFSIWGQASLDPLRIAVMAAAVGLAVLVAFRPRRKGLVEVSSLGAAVLIAMQLTAQHWFYLYIPWILPFVLVALMAPAPAPARSSRPARPY